MILYTPHAKFLRCLHCRWHVDDVRTAKLGPHTYLLGHRSPRQVGHCHRTWTKCLICSIKSFITNKFIRGIEGFYDVIFCLAVTKVLTNDVTLIPLPASSCFCRYHCTEKPLRLQKQLYADVADFHYQSLRRKRKNGAAGWIKCLSPFWSGLSPHGLQLIHEHTWQKDIMQLGMEKETVCKLQTFHLK